MNQVKFGLGFILILAMILAASSLFFGSRDEEEPMETAEILDEEQPEPVSKTRAQEAESIATERGITEQSIDGGLHATIADDDVEEPESHLESVFMNLTQEMARRGYAQGLSECIEGQFRENQGIENPKDLDGMLQTCEGEFKLEPKQHQQIRDVVLKAIAKAQTRPEDLDTTSVQ
jgi:hypothetical protein